VRHFFKQEAFSVRSIAFNRGHQTRRAGANDDEVVMILKHDFEAFSCQLSASPSFPWAILHSGEGVSNVGRDTTTCGSAER
jgi:hypothetical protein